MRSLLAFALLAAAAAPAWGADPEPNPDAELMRMEAAKWRPASLAHPFELMNDARAGAADCAGGQESLEA